MHAWGPLIGAAVCAAALVFMIWELERPPKS